MKRGITTLAASLALGLSTTALFAPPGGGRGGGGRGMGSAGNSAFSGDWMRWQQQKKEDEAKKKQEDADKKTHERSLQLLAEGWADLKAGDAAAATDAFTDALEMKVDEAEARLGLGLAKAADGAWGMAEKQFVMSARVELPRIELPKAKPATKPTAAANANGSGAAQPAAAAQPAQGNQPGRGPGRFRGFGPTPEEQAAAAEQKENDKIEASKVAFAKADGIRRLANYNLAVTYTRENQKPRAAVTLNTALSSYKAGGTVDEMVLNGLKSILGTLDEKAKQGIGLLPNMLRLAGEQDRALIAKYPNAERFGIGWVPMGAASQLRAAGKAEFFAADLPFVLPDDSVLIGKKAGGPKTNVLLPDLAAAAVNEIVASANIGIKPIVPPAAGPAPIGEVATGNPAPDMTRTPTRVEKPTLSRPGGDSATNPPIAPPPATPAPASPETPAVPAVATPATPATPAPEAPITGVTVRGAAFCVAPGVMATCARTVRGASTIRVTATDGDAFDAEVISSDDASGIALIKVPEKEFKPLPLGDKLKSGTAMVACFAKAGIFSPEMDILRADVTATTVKSLLRMGVHPRSAGAPVVDSQGKVIGIVSATRDDLVNALPVIPVETLRSVLGDKFTLSTAAVPPDAAVAEVTVTRK